MEVGDWVLLFTHHFPFALVRIAGPYNYIRSTAPEIGAWFRHFRKVDGMHLRRAQPCSILDANLKLPKKPLLALVSAGPTTPLYSWLGIRAGGATLQ